MNLTKEQKAVIDSPARQIIVSASAGSGKTEVMIQRICRLLKEGKRLSDMVVCSFTNAAAADMRKKLRNRLIGYIGTGESWAEIATRDLPAASITTVDGICSRICRDYFYCADLDPTAEILDANAAAALLCQTEEEVFADLFERDDPGFLRLSEIFSCSKSDRGLQRLVTRLLQLAAIQPDPGEWLLGAGRQADLHAAHIAAIGTWGEEYEDKAQALNAADSALTLPLTNDLIALTQKVQAVFAEKKQKKGALDFMDLEQGALRVLRSEAGGRAVREKVKYLFVDEYQDINRLQDAIFSALSEDPKTGSLTADRFFVGDVKQAIYRFRLSDPSIFIARKREIEESGRGEAHLLPHNFRSVKGVLDFTDLVFTGLMSEKFGGVDYVKERFIAGADVKFPAPVVCRLIQDPQLTKEEKKERIAESKETKTAAGPLPVYSVRRHRAAEEEDERLRSLEADCIAAHIQDLIGTEIEYREGGKKLRRKAGYGDFAVLLRGTGAFGGILKNKLQKAGIPVSDEKETDAASNPAVSALVAFLRLVSNRRDDISLAAVLKSNLGGFLSDRDLIAVRAHTDGGFAFDIPFWRAAEIYAADGRDETVKAALSKLFADLSRYEILSETEDFAALAGRTASERDCFKYALVADGQRTAAELGQFLDGLPGGLTLLEGLTALDAGEIKLTATQFDADAVRIMTIHASKGLEFPFVILADLYSKYNDQDLCQDCIIDSDLGVCMKFFDTEKGEKKETALWYRAKNSLRFLQREEELRILYVALTRAVYQTAVFAGTSSGFLPRAGFNTLYPLDYLYRPMLAVSPAFSKSACPKPDMRPVSVSVIPKSDFKLEKEIRSFTEFVYPGEKKPIKTTVTKLSRSGSAENENKIVYAPFALRDSRGTETGDAYHKFLETLDFTKTFAQSFCEFCKNDPQSGKLLDETVLAAAVRKVKDRIGDGRPYRELPFLYRCQEDGEELFVQGVIDLLIERADGIEIIDYKSGKISAELKADYQKQIGLYAKAASGLLGKPVLKKAIFSIHSMKFLEF